MDNIDNGTSKTTFWRVVGRALSALFVIGASLFIGACIGALLKDHFPSFRDGSVVLGVTLVISTMRDAVPQLQALGQFIWRGKTSPGGTLYGFAAFVSISAATFLVATVANEKQPINVGPFVFFQQSSTTGDSSQGFAPSKPIDNAEPVRVAIPFLLEPDTCNPTSDGAGIDFGNGTQIDPSAKALIPQLATGLLACAEAGKPVRVEIQGFASSQMFKPDCTGPEAIKMLLSKKVTDVNKDVNKQLNELLADDRAEVVSYEMNTAIKAARTKPELSAKEIEVWPLKWKRWDDMKLNLGLNDEKTARDGSHHADHNRGDFTRRADIVIKDAGDCKVMTTGAFAQKF